jgi:electron transfer flavoprotein alpha subunit
VILAFVESIDDEISQQALAFARALDDDVAAFAGQEPYAPAGWAEKLVEAIEEHGPAAVVAPGTDRGNEVLAHVAARLDQPLAANCVSVTVGDPAIVTRVRWGGSLLEEALVHGAPLLLTVAPHAVAAAPTGDIEVAELLGPEDGAVGVLEHLETASAGV